MHKKQKASQIKYLGDWRKTGFRKEGGLTTWNSEVEKSAKKWKCR